VHESTTQLTALLEGAELDFDTPPQGVDVADFLCVQHVSAHVSDEDTPTSAKQGLFAGSDPATFCLGLDVASVCLGTLRVEADCNEAAW